VPAPGAVEQRWQGPASSQQASAEPAQPRQPSAARARSASSALRLALCNTAPLLSPAVCAGAPIPAALMGST